MSALLQALALGPRGPSVTDRYEQGIDRGMRLDEILRGNEARQFIGPAVRGNKDALAQLLGLAPELGLQVNRNLEAASDRRADMDWRREEAGRSQRNSDRNYALDVRQLNASQERSNRDPYGERAAAAVAYGLKPGTPEYQTFVLTGNTPQEQRSTASDRAAIREADDMAFSAENAIGQLREAQALNDQAGSGMFANAQAWAARNDPTGIFDDKKGEATTNFSNLVLNQALGSLKAIFGAAPTEGERAILVELQASVDKSPAERRAILDRAVGLAERRLAFNRDRANELRGGTYYQPKGEGAPQRRSDAGQGAVDADALIEQANDAIRRGADPEKVRARLREQGVEADFGE